MRGMLESKMRQQQSGARARKIAILVPKRARFDVPVAQVAHLTQRIQSVRTAEQNQSPLVIATHTRVPILQ